MTLLLVSLVSCFVSKSRHICPGQHVSGLPALNATFLPSRERAGVLVTGIG